MLFVQDHMAKNYTLSHITYQFVLKFWNMGTNNLVQLSVKSLSKIICIYPFPVINFYNPKAYLIQQLSLRQINRINRLMRKIISVNNKKGNIFFISLNKYLQDCRNFFCLFITVVLNNFSATVWWHKYSSHGIQDYNIIWEVTLVFFKRL